MPDPQPPLRPEGRAGVSPAPFPVYLLDIDGVLLEPHGYRLALQATLDYFGERMGLVDLFPGEDAIEHFEAIGMTSEWDSTPILLAAVFDALLAGDPGLDLSGDPLAACAQVRARGGAGDRPAPALYLENIERLTRLLGPRCQPGQNFADLALSLNAPGGDPAACPFPNLCGHPLLSRLLGSARSLDGSLVTRVYEHFALGSDEYERAFQRPRLLDSPSLLATRDRPLLRPDARQRLLAEVRAGKLAAVVYTARASSVPGLDGTAGLSYSPEADLAIQAVGLGELPLLGSGQVCWLARETGSSVDQYVKPSPVHALAAVAAALTRDQTAALRAAERLARTGQIDDSWNYPALEIHVFEDSAGSVRGVRQAARLLAVAGRPASVHAWGIAQNPAKRAALLEAGAVICTDINHALDQAMSARSPLQS